jgi:hypothetical protein
MGLFDQYTGKIQTVVSIDIEALVRTPEGEYKKVWICEGYDGPDDENGILTLYREGDEIRGGIAQGSVIERLHSATCKCAVCLGIL